MRVALLGNMNNLFFAIVRHLRAAGVDAHLFLFDNEPAHFHPSADTFSLDYQAYTTSLPYGNWRTFSKAPREHIAEATRGFDFLMGTGIAPALLHRAGKKLDIFMPYGEDLEFLARRWWPGLPDPRALLTALTLPRHQRAGIREAAVCIGTNPPSTQALYAELGIKGRRVIAPLTAVCSLEFSPERVPEYANRSHFYPYFKKLRDSADLLLWHHGRITMAESHWKSGDAKGTQKVIAGFAAFARKHPDIRAKLALFEYGPEVNAAREIVRSLGIADNVAWFPLMPRKEIFIGMNFADITCGELGLSYNYGGAILEGLAMAKPLLHYRRDEDFPEAERYPILCAKTAQDVEAQLEAWREDPERVREIGRAGRRFFEHGIVESGTATLLALIEEKRATGRVTARTVDPSLVV